MAAWADGWAPWHASPEEVAEGRRTLNEECERAGRDPGSTTITVFTGRSGSELVGAYREAGADRVVFTMDSTPERDPFGRLERLAKTAGL